MGLWVFGYGSLLWDPGFVPVAQHRAVLRDYHRSFCMLSIHHRGTTQNPGLVLALDAQPGAQCTGVAFQVAPDAVAYSFNEPDRLARAVSTVIVRELMPATEIVAWLESFAKPGSMEKWSDAFGTPAGMAQLHNTKLFLRAMSDQLDGEDVDAAVADTLAQLVQGFTGLI